MAQKTATTTTVRVIAIVVALVVAAIGGGYTVAWSQASIGSTVESLGVQTTANAVAITNQDVRLRHEEQSTAAVAAKLDAMQADIERQGTDITWIRRKLESN